jgi:hypothetical protein
MVECLLARRPKIILSKSHHKYSRQPPFYDFTDWIEHYLKYIARVQYITSSILLIFTSYALMGLINAATPEAELNTITITNGTVGMMDGGWRDFCP